jgi:hypothetical protein
MEDNNNSEHSSGDDSDTNSKYKHENKFNKCQTLDEGTFAFMHWLNSEDKQSLSSTDNPIVLLKFVNDKHTILYDTRLCKEVDVEISKGVPFCRYCKEDDCAHVGFAVCIEQLCGHRRTRKEETAEDILQV